MDIKRSKCLCLPMSCGVIVTHQCLSVMPSSGSIAEISVCMYIMCHYYWYQVDFMDDNDFSFEFT